MESLVFLALFASVLAMAVGLYRISKHAIGALRTFERERGAMPPAPKPPAMKPAPVQSREGVEAQLERVAEQLARVAQGQEILLQAMTERAVKARTPSQGVQSPIIPN
jgi:hypothetical protein